MKILLTIVCCAISFNALAEDTYVPPTELAPAEIKQAKAELAKNKTTLKNHWQNRLALAKENDKKLAKPGMPLQKPYYGDFAQQH